LKVVVEGAEKLAEFFILRNVGMFLLVAQQPDVLWGNGDIGEIQRIK
jgi:hypothetical protein